MADNASIARPYAKAVFDLATEAGNQDDWSVALKSLAAVAEDETFSTFVNSPQVKADEIEELLTNVVGKQLPAGGDNFIKLLTQNNRLDILPELQQQYAMLVLQSRKSVEAEVVSARPLSAEQKNKLVDALKERLGVAVSITESVDETLIGGAIIKAGDLVIDGSAKGRVEKLAIALS
jgi:F-type H+-transporting ATPase subunit delta